MTKRRRCCPPRARRRPAGFTLIELLVVLGIILVLVGILLPTVKKVRERAQEASVRAQVASLDSAIQRYSQDFNAYPGPLPRSVMYPVVTTIGIKGGGTLANVTGAENLVLGLLGGLAPTGSGGAIQFDNDLIGRGPRSLNPSNPKAYTAYIDGMLLSPYDPLNPGKGYFDDAGDADDSAIPEILDKFNNPMPILYLRAQKGAGGVVSEEGKENGANITDASGNPLTATQYDIREILAYTKPFNNQSIGEGKTIKQTAYVNPKNSPSAGNLPHGLSSVDSKWTLEKGGTDYRYPYDAFAYFQNRAVPPNVKTNPNGTGTPRKKDGYILISAGADRVYGTEDDITNFGSVLE